MVDLCLHQTSRSLGSTIDLCREFAILCQVSLFPCFLVYDCAYAVYHLLTCACCKLWSRATLGITCPQQSCFAFSLPDLMVEAGCTKCCWSVGFCFIFLFAFVTLFVPSLLTTVSQIGLCTWRFDTLVNWGRV